MPRARAERDRPRRGPPTRPESSAPLRAPAATLSNRGLAALLGVHREEGWTSQGPDEEILKLVHDPLVASQVARFEAELDAMAGKAAGTLIEMWKIFVSSFQGGKTGGGARVGAATEGTPGTVAAHGFMNMPDRLAAALAGSDGGNLDWLGAELARDFMHFQLKAANRPSLR